MCAITALAHLNASVLYFLDPSESCGYSVQQQVALFENIKPLFSGKPLVVVCTKTDLKRLKEVEPEKRKAIETWGESNGIELMHMSRCVLGGASEECSKSLEITPPPPPFHPIPFSLSHAEEGVSEVKDKACRLLLERRLEAKMQSKKVDGILSRINVVRPEARDSKARRAHIPESVLRRRREAAAAAAAAASAMDEDGAGGDDDDDDAFAPGAASRGTGSRHVGIKGRTGGKAVAGTLPGGRKTQKQIMWEKGGPGVYAQKMYEHWQLKRKEWQTDIVGIARCRHYCC